MPFAAAAVVPHPPLLVPELGRGASEELDALRAACLRAVEATVEEAGALVLVGAGPAWALAQPGAAASFAPYGADVRIALPAAAGDGREWSEPDRLAGALASVLPEPARLDALPLSLAVAAWLLARRGRSTPPLAALTVPASFAGGEAAALGRALGLAAAPHGRVGLLAMGDLSARRGATAPATPHPDADAFDRQAGQALRDGQPCRLLDLDPALAATLRVAGLAPLHVLAGALEQAGPLRGAVLYEDAPYGVGYLVGTLGSS
jgi:hypothetical protein